MIWIAVMVMWLSALTEHAPRTRTLAPTSSRGMRVDSGASETVRKPKSPDETRIWTSGIDSRGLNRSFRFDPVRVVLAGVQLRHGAMRRPREGRPADHPHAALTNQRRVNVATRDAFNLDDFAGLQNWRLVMLKIDIQPPERSWMNAPFQRRSK
jgi:hypothetical protein